MRRLFTALVAAYQRTLSPDHGLLRGLFPYGCCRFYPSCSEYARQAVERHGAYGLRLMASRFLRCHPWSSSSLDPVPRVLPWRREGS